MFLLLVAAIAAIWLSRARLEPEIAREHLRWSGRPARFEGLAVSPIKEESRGRKLLFEIEMIDGASFAYRALLYLPPNAVRPRPGDRLAVLAGARRPRPARNAGEFDERRFLSERSVAWILRARRVERLDAPVPPRLRLRRAAESLRWSIEDAYRARLDSDHARLLAGLTLGYKGALARELNRDAQDAGVMHLLVPSGAKVAFVIALFLAAGSLLGLPAPARAAATALGAGFYAVMVGGEAPYARAYLAWLAFEAGRLTGRESGAFQAVVLSALLVLAWEPRELFSAGFQMTYAAMAALLVAMPTVNAALRRRHPLMRRLGGVLAVTAIVQAALWPTFAQTFGKGSTVGLAANLLLVPASGPLMGAGFTLWAAERLGWERGAAALARLCAASLELFARACARFAEAPGAAIALSPMRPLEIAAFYAALFAILVWPRRRASAALAAAALLLGAGDAAARRLSAAPLRVLYLHLGRRPGAAVAALASYKGSRHRLYLSSGRSAPVRDALRVYRVGELEAVFAANDAAVGAALKLGVPRERIALGPLPALELGWVRFDFSKPRLRRGDAEFSIMPDLLRRVAVEVSTDGSEVTIKDASGQAHH